MIKELPITEFTLSQDKIIWDVRDANSYADGHIEFATNQPLDSLNADLLNQTEGTIYILCGGGTKAGKAVTILNEIDPSRDIVHLTGGTRGAKSAGMKIVSEAN